jgi:hypothetical protein
MKKEKCRLIEGGEISLPLGIVGSVKVTGFVRFLAFELNHTHLSLTVSVNRKQDIWGVGIDRIFNSMCPPTVTHFFFKFFP